MKKQHTTKYALLLSALSLLMCVSMLIGSTFAWFTDSVTSNRNMIQSGNLDVELYYTYDAEVAKNPDSDAWEQVTAATDVFGYDLWEPGYTKVAYFKVANKGSLALKYQLSADVFDEKNGVNQAGREFLLSDYIKTALVEPDAGRDDILALTGTPLKNSFDMGKGTLGADETAVVGLAIWMPTTVDNEANHDGNTIPEISFRINLLATQNTVEIDSFDNTYDADSRFPLGKSVSVEADFAGCEAEVNIPAEAPAPADAYTLKITDYSYTNDNTQASLSFDMKLMDGNAEAPSTSLAYSVSIKLPHPFVNMDNFQVLHNNEPVENLRYDKETRTIHFTTTGFSPFEIKYIDYTNPSFALEYKEQDNHYAITKGTFFVNPVDYFVNNANVLDKVATIDSSCIAVDFVKDGVKHYIVSERDTTVFIAADATTEYVCENGTFNKDNVDFRSGQSDKLYLAFGDFENSVAKNDYSTVYLLPGTYNEDSVINVISNVSIIGLGDTDEVKVIKVKGSFSNKHLFNCTGTKAEHIHVTLYNLYLDSTAKNLNSAGKLYIQENAAVQSIRKAMVKCYDLTVKHNGFPFYVNAKQEVPVKSGNYYPAYMYVENVKLSKTSGEVLSYSSVSSTAAYFTHSDLIYSDGISKYTKAGKISGRDGICYIANQTMAANDWDWEN